MNPTAQRRVQDLRSQVAEALEELGYTRRESDRVVQLVWEHSDIKWSLCRYLMLNAQPDQQLSSCGMTYKTLRGRFFMDPVNALTTLAWLRRDPEAAQEELAMGIR